MVNQPAPFEVTLSSNGSATTVAVSGEFDLAGVDVFRDRVEDAAGAGRSVIVDLSAVEFMDSTGLGALVVAKQRVEGDAWRFSLAEPSAPVSRLLKISGLWPVFFDTAELTADADADG